MQHKIPAKFLFLMSRLNKNFVRSWNCDFPQYVKKIPKLMFNHSKIC